MISAAVLAWLWRSASPSAVLAALRDADWRWIGLAALVEVGVQLLRARRVAAAIGGPPARSTAIALAFAAANLVVPARASDLAAAAWIARDAEIGLARSVAGMAAVTFADMLTHAAWVLGAAILAAGVVEEVRRIETISLTALVIVVGVGTVAVARRIAARGTTGGAVGVGFRHALRGLGPAQILGSIVQLGGVLVIFRLDLEAVHPTFDGRWTAVALCQALGAIVSFLLPAAMGAGPTTAGSAILPLFGATAAQAVAFGAAVSLTATVPDALVSLPAWMWLTRREAASATTPDR